MSEIVTTNSKIFTHCADLSNHLINLKSQKSLMVWATSGGFDPLHIGHLRCFQEMKLISKKSVLPGISSKTVVILNGDGFLMRKKGYVFMPAAERAEIIAELECVDYVTFWDDGTQFVNGALRSLRPDFFCKGGDRNERRVVPEFNVCDDIGCKVLFNVGGNKIQSSSTLVERSNNAKKTYNI